jgi:hypothetical protein
VLSNQGNRTRTPLWAPRFLDGQARRRYLIRVYWLRNRGVRLNLFGILLCMIFCCHHNRVWLVAGYRPVLAHELRPVVGWNLAVE